MTGTSMDAVDAVLVDISTNTTQSSQSGDGPNEFKVIAMHSHPYPSDLKDAVLSICQGQQTTLRTLGEIDHRLAILFADAVNALLSKANVKPSDVKAIGCHGQTVWHQPTDTQYPFTMQIGDNNIVAERTSINVVGDFRRRDMACGGQGAPLVPIFHSRVLANDNELRIVVNIGGISNFTVLHPGEPVVGYDTGPGNILLDAWINQCTGETFDKDGVFASQGTTNQQLLRQMIESTSYFGRSPPKSTGREQFNLEWLHGQLDKFNQQHSNTITLSPNDVQSTLVDLTVESIASHVDLHGGCDRLLVCGGGARNQLIMDRLEERMPNAVVEPTSSVGVDGDAIECLAFAYLAYLHVNHMSGNVPSVTGATKSTILGAMYPKWSPSH
ncbi:hypothetical protein SAMD00019534_066470 [Acytostelium subglobosum LB1]|uniref:hypothetical protein n=1 Tax=Acytostelium subglobosum LB1 TaxID=1410327 RepID=UPI000644E891|nr:hypothetical protein SAMD00019534_066470 [Acytostelium subglobosum LB1]GAM23472.1 hypothetical protein SAMD00019534_066470 [Acytostelium subglobosum LB1]|eukprot:XP_012753921.1 hypothetical protein SAMD00019534_066470 [Acytostelium subglobosum LB1]